MATGALKWTDKKAVLYTAISGEVLDIPISSCMNADRWLSSKSVIRTIWVRCTADHLRSANLCLRSLVVADAKKRKCHRYEDNAEKDSLEVHRSDLRLRVVLSRLIAKALLDRGRGALRGTGSIFSFVMKSIKLRQLSIGLELSTLTGR